MTVQAASDAPLLMMTGGDGAFRCVHARLQLLYAWITVKKIACNQTMGANVEAGKQSPEQR